MSDKKQEIIGTPTAAIGFVYLSFCSFTDGKLSEDEMGAVGSELDGIMKAFGVTVDDQKKNLKDAVTMYDGCSTWSEMKDLFVQVLDLLKVQSFWTPSFGEYIINALTRLMDADGEQHENETYWIEAIKKAWQI